MKLDKYSWPFENEIYQTLIVSFITWIITCEKFQNLWEDMCVRVWGMRWGVRLASDANAPAGSSTGGAAWRRAGAARQSLHDRGTDSVEPLRCKRLTF